MLCCCVFLLEKVILISSVKYPLCCCELVEPMYYGRIGTIHKCPDYQGVLIIQFSLHAKAPFLTMTKCVDYAGILIIKCPH